MKKNMPTCLPAPENQVSANTLFISDGAIGSGAACFIPVAVNELDYFSKRGLVG
jgi:hypothetical protein